MHDPSDERFRLVNGPILRKGPGSERFRDIKGPEFPLGPTYEGVRYVCETPRGTNKYVIWFYSGRVLVMQLPEF